MKARRRVGPRRKDAGNETPAPDIVADPFGEHAALIHHTPMQIMGGRFRFTSNDARLLELVDQAYAGLPPQVLSAPSPQFQVQLMLTTERAAPHVAAPRSPPALYLLNGAGFLVGTAASTVVVLCARERTGLVAVSPQMLRFPYYTRYELIEFAVATLAARAQQLVPLHAACIGLGDRAVLLLGPSGAGKTTVALHCLMAGMEFLSEDAVFVAPQTLRATGAANFIHVRTDSVAAMERSRMKDILRASPIITRRSGVDKYEVDLRHRKFSLATAPLKIVATVFLSAQRAMARRRLRTLSPADLRSRLTESQSYAASLPQWQSFLRRISKVPAFEVRRGDRPTDTVEVLRAVLAHH